jgi:parallel beta-helix repeat protein
MSRTPASAFGSTARAGHFRSPRCRQSRDRNRDRRTAPPRSADGILVANSSLYLQLGASIIDDNTISSNSNYAVFVVGSENEIFSNSLSFNGINQVVAQPGTVNSIYGSTGIGSHWLGYGETFVVYPTTLNAL